MKRLALIVGLLVAMSSAAVAQDSSEAKPKAPKKQASVIALWEIEPIQGQARDAYDVIQLLRPRFLQIRSKAAASEDPRWGAGPGVLIDDAPRGGIEALRSIPVGAIREIRYLSGPDAASRYGPEYHAGAIVVVAK